jgi:hypothetical protein
MSSTMGSSSVAASVMFASSINDGRSRGRLVHK